MKTAVFRRYFLALTGLLALSNYTGLAAFAESPVPSEITSPTLQLSQAVYAPLPEVKHQNGVTLMYPKPVAYVAPSSQQIQQWQKRLDTNTSTSPRFQPDYFQAAFGTNRSDIALQGFIQRYNRQLTPDQVQYLSLHLNNLSQQYGVPPKLMAGIVAVESSFRHDAVSPTGAIGLGQLKPDTARWLGVSNPFDPIDNLTGTARYLGYLLQRFNGEVDKAIASYFQGQGSVERDGIQPASQHYLTKVTNAMRQLES